MPPNRSDLLRPLSFPKGEGWGKDVLQAWDILTRTSLRFACPLLSKRRGGVLLFLLVVAVFSCTRAYAEEATPLDPITLQDVQAQDMKSLRDLVIDKEKGLQLREALQWLKETHPELRLARLKLQQAEAKFLATQGAFDPNFKGEYMFKEYNSSTDIGKQRQSFLTESAVGILTRYGLQVEGGYRTRRGQISTTVQPVGEGGEAFLNFILPLLRYGRGKNPLAIAERKAALALKVAALDLALKELNLQNKLGETYWEWLAARKLVQNSEEVLDLAQTRQKQVDRRADVGDIAAIAKIENQKEVQKRISQLAKDILDARKANIKLSLLLWNRDVEAGRLDVDEAWVPLLGSVPAPEDLDEALLLQEGKLAVLRTHPRLMQFPVTKDMAALDIDLAKQLFLPKLDAIISPSYQFGNEGIGPALYGGLKVEMPIRNRTGKGKLREAELILQALDVDYIQTYQTLLADVEQSLLELEQYYTVYQASLQEWQATQALEKGERTKFALGDSTLFVVNIRERETALAFRSVVDAEMNYHQAMIRYLTTTTQI